jgi:predicted PurR-regulated permease PerM
MTSDIVTVAATAILVLFLTAYFVVEAKVMWPQLLAWLPKEKAARAATLIRPLEARLGGYIRGQLLVCLAVSTFLTIGMSLLRVEHALVLGLLSGLLNLVPFVGSMTTALLAILVAFNQSPMLAGAVVLLFVFEQWVESNLIVPNLLGKQVELHPLVVLFAILIFASILGVAGALIAVPVATAGMFLAEEFYLRPMKNREAEEEVRVARAAEAQSEDIDRSYEAAAAILSETASGAHLRLEKERLEQEQKQRATQREQSGENNPQSAEVEPEQSNEV